MESTLPAYIVLAEDNPGDIVLVREAFRQHEISCNLHVLKDGEAALDYFSGLSADENARCPDLVLLDLNLPKHNGDKVLQNLRAGTRCATTPVLVLTSSESRLDRHRIESHAARYFRKPSTLADFMLLGGIVKDLLQVTTDRETALQIPFSAAT